MNYILMSRVTLYHPRDHPYQRFLESVEDQKRRGEVWKQKERDYKYEQNRKESQNVYARLPGSITSQGTPSPWYVQVLGGIYAIIGAMIILSR